MAGAREQRRFALRGCGIAMLLAACADGAPAAPNAQGAEPTAPRDFASGTRLRATYDSVGGDVDVLVGFHDTALDLDCAFGDDPGPGPTWWCLPTALARHDSHTGPYLNADCTEATAIAPPDGDAAYAILSPLDSCASPPAVRIAMPGTSERVFGLAADGSCVRGGSIRVQRLGDAVPIDTFVSARETVGGAGRIRTRTLVASDGAASVTGGFDVRLGAAVAAARGRWAPARVAFAGAGDDRFADASCATIAATKIGHDAICPPSAAFVFADSCGNGTWHVLGNALPALRRRDERNACTAAPPSDGLLGFSLGAEIPDATFVAVTTLDVGGSRAARRGYAADGPAVSWREIVDPATGEPCVVATASDGRRRCVPAAEELVAYYTDATCTRPAFAHARTGCPADSPRFVRDAATPRAFAVAEPLTAIFTSAGGCGRFEPVVPSDLFAADEVAPDRFPLAQRFTE